MTAAVIFTAGCGYAITPALSMATRRHGLGHEATFLEAFMVRGSGAGQGAVLPARRTRVDPRLGLLADFVIPFNFDLLPATTAPVTFNG